MSTALQDLPDPLEPPPTLPSSSPDDLLAKMADDAIDQLMAGADPDAPPPPEPPPVAEKVAEPEPIAEPIVETPLEPPAGEASAVVDVTPEPEPVTAIAADPALPPADRQALLHEDLASDRGTSPLLWPLWLLNWPFAFLGERTRMFAGLLAIVTLVPAGCAIVWVLFMKGK